MKIIILGISIIVILLTFTTSCASQPVTPESKTPNTTTQVSTSQPTPSKPGSSNSTTPINVIPTRTHEEAPVIITRQSDGQVVHVNLVKFAGSVSSPNTTVFINNTLAMVARDGSYSLLLELVKGQNVIEIKTTQADKTNSDKLTVTFEPPTALIMKVNYDNNTDYRRTPLIVTGTVNNPAAEVTIYQSSTLQKDMTRASVASDGTYSAQLHIVEVPPYQPLVLMAVAKLGDEIDVFQWVTGGSYGPPRDSMVDILPREPMKIIAGDSGVLDCVLSAQIMNAVGDIFPSAQCKLGIVRLADINNTSVRTDTGTIEGPKAPDIQGLKIEITPSEFTIFPNIHYHLSISVTTATTLTPGTYYFGIEGFPHTRGNLIFSVIAESPK